MYTATAQEVSAAETAELQEIDNTRDEMAPFSAGERRGPGKLVK